MVWKFAAPAKKKGGGPPGGGLPQKKTTAVPETAPIGVNSLAILRKAKDAFGIVAGVSNDTVYCFPPKGGDALWKAPMPGDAWKVAAFPDQDGDGIEEVLVACGLDVGFLLNGASGAVLWSHAVTANMGAVSVAAAGDMTGDGKPDALIGDGGGKLHCVPGNASGLNVAAAWTYDFRDTSTIHSIAALQDVDGDSRTDCAVGTSHDLVALISGKGTKLWSVNMGGTVFSVANLGDLDGNGSEDVGAGTEMGFAAAYQGFGTTSTRLALGAFPGRPAWAPVLRLSRSGGIAIGFRDLKGRALPSLMNALPPATGLIPQGQGTPGRPAPDAADDGR